MIVSGQYEFIERFIIHMNIEKTLNEKPHISPTCRGLVLSLNVQPHNLICGSTFIYFLKPVLLKVM